MKEITFYNFRRLPDIKKLTLQELSINICGTSRLVGFLSKLQSNFPVSIGENFKEVAKYVESFGYNLIVDTDFNTSSSRKDKKIEELTNELVHYKNLVNIYKSKLEQYEKIDAIVNAINLLNEEENFILKVRKARTKTGGK